MRGVPLAAVMAKTQQQKIILGLKVRQFRQELAWNFEELSRKTGISVSYLNEIEKGKKYPQPVNLQKLADALGSSPEFLASSELTGSLAPLGDLLQSNFLNELPLELFGIDMQQVVEIIARAPDRVNAFISALLEIARNYSLRDEHFFFAALRAYQELRGNYFEEIEQAAAAFALQHDFPGQSGVSIQTLRTILERDYGYRIETEGLERYPGLQTLRSVYVPKGKRLLLHGSLSERQKVFQLAKEIGFNALQLKERPLTSTILRVHSFEEALNNYKAAYFAVAILINRDAFVNDLRGFFGQTNWNSQLLLQLMSKYQVSPEVLFQRFNVLTQGFGLSKIFFMRIIHDLDRDGFDIDKELHLNRHHQPHATGLNEHYCRRWMSIELLRELGATATITNSPMQPLTGIQRATFLDSSEEYLCISMAKHGHPMPGRNVSVTLGILLDDRAKKVVRFWKDPAIPNQTVNVTCQRCALEDCAERAAPPLVVEKKAARRRMLEALDCLEEGAEPWPPF
jgi:XRE family transcriptional regulator, fatty acid utilization regulator